MMISSRRTWSIDNIKKIYNKFQSTETTYLEIIPNKKQSIPGTLKTPTALTQEEIEEHNLTHLPYRDWCKHCHVCTRKEQTTISTERWTTQTEHHPDRLLVPQERQ
eukprot:5811374-Amphidinium_carterae.1